MLQANKQAIHKQGKQQKQGDKYINKIRLVSPHWIHQSYPVHQSYYLMYCNTNMDRRIQTSKTISY